MVWIDGSLFNRTSVNCLFISSISTKRHSITSQKSSLTQLCPNKSCTKCVREEESLPGNELEHTCKWKEGTRR